MNSKLILFVIFWGAYSNAINAQSFSKYKHLIDLEEKEAVLQIEELGYQKVNKQIVDGCNAYKFEKDTSSVIYNVCIDEEGQWVNFNLMERDLEKTVTLLNEAKSDTTLIPDISTVGANSSFIFIEDGAKEIYFMFDHTIDLFVMEVANHARFEMMKEHIEDKTDFKTYENVFSLFREMINHENESGESIEDVLAEFEIDIEPNIVDLELIYDDIDTFKKSDKYIQFQQEIDKHLLGDKSYVKKVMKSLVMMQMANMNKENWIENTDEIMAKIAIENNKFKSMLMLDYICEKVAN